MSSALVQVTVEEIKALVVRVACSANVAERPLADAARHVTGLLQQGGHGLGSLGKHMHVVAGNRRVSRVFACKEHEASWSAHGVSGVVVGKA